MVLLSRIMKTKMFLFMLPSWKESACAVCSTASVSALKPTRIAAGLPPEIFRF